MYLKILQIILLLTFVTTTYSQNRVNELPKPATTAQTPDTTKTQPKIPEAKKDEGDIDAPINYNARDSILFDNDSKMMYLYGEAKLVYKDIELTSEYIEMDLEKSTIYAIGIKDSVTGKMIGSPIFKEGSETFKSENMKYNFKTKRGLINGVISEQSGGFLHSEITKKQEDESIHIKHAKYTTCNLDHPHFYIGLTKAKVIPDDKIVSGPAYFVIEDVVMPIGIPFGFFPNKSGNTSGVIIPDVGEEPNRGFYLRKGGYYFALSDYFDLTTTADIYTKGSWGAHLNSNYKKRYAFSGYLDFDYQNIQYGFKETPSFRKSYTYMIKWTHKQDTKARPYSNFSASVNIGKSDFYKFSNTINPSQYLQNTRQSSVSYTKRFASLPFSFSTNLRHSQNNLDSTLTLSIPEIDLSMSRIYPLKRKNKVGESRFYEKIGFSYSTNMKNSVQEIKEYELFKPNFLDKFDNGIRHTIPISANWKLFKYFTLNPSANLTSRMYFKYVEQTWDDTLSKAVKDTLKGFNLVNDYSLSASFTTKIYAMFTYKSKTIKAIRHVMTPNISFSYKPDYTKSKYNYYQKYYNEKDSLDVIYSRFENGIYGNAPKTNAGSSVIFLLGNNLEMKVKNDKDTITGTKKINIFETLNLSTAYNIAADSLNWSPLTISGSSTLFKNLRINYGATLNPYVLDSLGKTILNRFVWQDSSKIARLTSANISMSYSLKSKSKSKTKKDETKTEQLIGYPDSYVDFDIPWNISFQYILIYSNPNKTPTLNQTISVRGDLNLTPKWKITLTTGYNISKKDISYTTVEITRDLHCWQMSFFWVPFGFSQSFNFQLNVKSAILKDLKLNKRSSWSDNYYD